MSYRFAGFLSVLLTSVGLAAVSYRVGRTHAAWRDVRSAKYSVREGRRIAWGHTIRLAGGVVLLALGLLAAGFELSR